MADFPRDDLIRMVDLPLAQIEFRDDTDGRLMVGTPIVFNIWTEVESWEGHFLEQMSPGSVTKTLKERGDKVKVLFNHGFDPQIGDKPLGKPRLMEPRAKGLYTETPLSKTSYNADLIELLGDGALDGMSFRFSVTRESWDENGKVNKANPKGLPMRTIEEIRLYEFGPVTFPAYEATTVGVRGREAYNAWRTVHKDSSAEQADSDADLPVTSEEPIDTPPVVAPVAETPEPILLMPVRRLDQEKLRETIAAYTGRADKIERTRHA